MLRKIALGILGIFFLLAPLAPVSAAIFCPTLTENMRQGYCDQNLDDPDCAAHVTGDQVSQLQHFLKDYYNNPTGLWMSGYFGGKTKAFVVRFQGEWDLPTTGNVYGLTRAAIAQACQSGNTGNGDNPPAPPTPPNPPVTPTSCTFNGSTIQDGRSVAAYKTPTVPVGQSCYSSGQWESRVCNHGILSGSYQYSSCTTSGDSAPLSCTTPWGATVPNNSATVAYQSPSVPAGQQCVSQERVCVNGTLSGSYQYQTCVSGAGSGNTTTLNATPSSGPAPLVVTFNGQQPNDNVQRTLAFGDGAQTTLTCSAIITTGCLYNATHTYTAAGTYTARISHVTFPEATIDAQTTVTITSNGTSAQLCQLPWGGTIGEGQSVDAYSVQGVDFGMSCSTYKQTRTCHNGVLSGSYQYQSCTASGNTTHPPPSSPLSCTTPWGTVIANGSVAFAYQSPSVPAGQHCTLEERICVNGVLSGSYQYNSCTVSGNTPPPPPTNATLTATPSSGSAPLTVTLRTNSIPESSNRLLDFGDGQQAVPGGLCTIEPRNCSYGQDHIYQTPGTYIAKFFTDGQLRAQTTVTVGGSGGSSSSQDTLTVQSGYSATGAAPLSIRFVGQLFPTPTQPAGSNFVATLDYGDGTSDAVSGLAIVGPCGGSLGGCGYQSPYYGVGPHVYNTPGTYTAKLIREGVIEKTLTITVTGSGGTTPSITITSPASGTSAAMGSTLHIAWQSQNAPAGAWVRLYLDTISIDSGYAKPATGSYDFIVPGGVTGSHTIRAVLLPEGQVNPGLATASVSVTFTSTFGSTAAPGNSQLANALTALQGALQALANVLGN